MEQNIYDNNEFFKGYQSKRGELSALLHDIAITDRKLDRSRHNEDSLFLLNNY